MIIKPVKLQPKPMPAVIHPKMNKTSLKIIKKEEKSSPFQDLMVKHTDLCKISILAYLKSFKQDTNSNRTEFRPSMHIFKIAMLNKRLAQLIKSIFK